MADYGITETGFKRKRLDLLLQELNDEFRSIFGDNVDLSPQSPDGQVNGVVSESNANLWEIAEEAYNAFNPSAATGEALSSLVQLNGILRKEATFSVVALTLTGTPGTSVPAGSLVSDLGQTVTFSTDSTLVLDGGGSAIVNATATETGPKMASPGTLTNILTPITGWSAVTNVLAAIEGQDDETDTELRARREASININAQSIFDAMYAALLALEDVTALTLLENDTNVTDINGLPPHSFEVIIQGGDDIEIANTIWLKKPAGIFSNGTESELITDSQGLPHTIRFTRPTPVTIYVIVNLTTFAEYPADGDDRIKQALVDYAAGDLIDGQDFGVGEDVIYSRLYTPVNSVQGHQVDSLFIGIAPAPSGTSNITIDFDEVSFWDVANIVVNS